ncbi:MAG: DUF3829 domain-containing protein [Deltaproteobacteria bacterium]|nr:DUF3829 domain-containing protein [Deltaproteobacteria bacterium]
MSQKSTPRSIVCPNCGGPVPPNTTTASLACGYCRHHFKNPLYEKPTTVPTGPRSSGAEKTVLTLVLLSVLGFPLIIGGIVFGIYSYAARQTEKYAEQIQKTMETVPPVVPSIEPAPVPSPEPVATSSPMAENAMDPLEQKLGVYIDCLEDSLPTVQRAMERYLSWMKTPKTGPTCKERYISYGMYSWNDYIVERCSKIAEANALPPSLPDTQQAALAHLKALQTAAPVFKSASLYYSQKRYELDDCAEGKRLHPLLAASYRELESTYRAFYQSTAAKSKGSLARCLARTGKSPEMRGAHDFAALMIFAQQMVNTYTSESKKNAPDVKAMKQIAAKLVEKAEALRTLTKEQRDAAGYGSSAESAVNQFLESIMEFVKSEGGKKLNHSARFFIRNGHNRSNYAGTPEHLHKTFNDLLNRYNYDMKPCGKLLPCNSDGCPDR